MKKLLFVLCLVGLMFAEGKLSGVTYFDYTNTEKQSGFYFQRQYFGYGGEVSDKVSFKILFDVGRTNNKWLYTWSVKGDDSLKVTEDTRLVTYLKKVQVNYKSSFGNFNFGLIGMNTYGVQEKNWGYRFLEKSAIDKYGFSATADLGVGFSRSITDQLNMSLQIVNGEGFKKPQSDKYHKIAFNSTYGERNLVKNSGFNAGVVYTTEQTDNKPNIMTSLFGGFAGMGLRLGGQYNVVRDGQTKLVVIDSVGAIGATVELESNIISVSANYAVRNNIDIFARYDMVDDNDITNKNGENYLVTGIVLTCNGGISVAPNVRITTSEDETASVTEYKINFQFKF